MEGKKGQKQKVIFFPVLFSHCGCHQENPHQTISFVQLAATSCNPHTNGPSFHLGIASTQLHFQAIQKKISTKQNSPFRALNCNRKQRKCGNPHTLMVLPSSSASHAHPRTNTYTHFKTKQTWIMHINRLQDCATFCTLDGQHHFQ